MIPNALEQIENSGYILCNYFYFQGLNEKFKSQITNTTPQLYLPAYFTCQMKCQSCSTGCTLSMGHVDEGKTHFSTTQCRFQHQFQNCVYLCKVSRQVGSELIPCKNDKLHFRNATRTENGS